MARRRHVVLGPLLAITALLLAAGMVASWGIGQARSRVATPVPTATAARAGDGYLLWALRSDGSPVRWDPCTPVRWTTRPSDPAWLRTLAADAADTLGASAGVTFEYVASSDETVGPSRALTDGRAWAPVLVTLTTPEESGWLAANERGLALPVTVAGQFVTGQVLLQAHMDLTPDMASREGSWGATLMHEWGHVVGLDHVGDPAQLMHAEPLPGPAAWGPGDLRGFRALGADPTCLPSPPATEVEMPTPARR
jgi:hypothetical protein